MKLVEKINFYTTYQQSSTSLCSCSPIGTVLLCKKAVIFSSIGKLTEEFLMLHKDWYRWFCQSCSDADIQVAKLGTVILGEDAIALRVATS